MIVVHRLNALLAVCVGVSSALVFVGGHEAGELDVFTGLAFGGWSVPEKMEAVNYAASSWMSLYPSSYSCGVK